MLWLADTIPCLLLDHPYFTLFSYFFFQHAKTKFPSNALDVTPQRMCRVCKGRGVWKDTRFFCGSCGVPLCNDECFQGVQITKFNQVKFMQRNVIFSNIWILISDLVYHKPKFKILMQIIPPIYKYHLPTILLATLPPIYTYQIILARSKLFEHPRFSTLWRIIFKICVRIYMSYWIYMSFVFLKFWWK